MDLVPTFDAGLEGPPAHLAARRAEALALRRACLGWLPLGGLLARIADPIARTWLRRSGTPYFGEVSAIAATLGTSGIWLLHCAYAAGCTALADEGPAGPILRRTLDWPFPGLGRLVEVVRQRGPAGDFLNVTWPGFAGVLTAVGPGRFAASINQAPMRRRFRSNMLLWLDYGLNAIAALGQSGRLPPEHLLRVAFETCRTFDEARRLLTEQPVARPAIFLLCGLRPDERLLIERLEDSAKLHADRTVAANAWREEQGAWRPRVCGEGTPQENNRRRVEALSAQAGHHPPDLGWATPPVLNPSTRTAIELDAVAGRVTVAGWEDGRRVTAVTQVVAR